MQESDISVVRGVSIAAIIFSVLEIVLFILLTGLFVWLSVVASNASYFEWYVDTRDDLGMTHGIDAYYGFDAETTSDWVSGLFGIFGILMAVGIVFCVVSLLAGIMGVRNCRNPQKVGMVMGWSIAGAVCSILSLRVVTCILLVVNAVYASRLRRASQNPAVFAQNQNPAAYPPPGWGYGFAQGYPAGNMPSDATSPTSPQPTAASSPFSQTGKNSQS